MRQLISRGVTFIAALLALVVSADCFAGPTPAIYAGYGSSGQAPYTLHVHGLNTGFTHGDRLTALFEWDFGDANGVHNKIVGFNAAHIYDNPGNYTVRLTVTDENGVKASTTMTVSVAADTRQTIYVASNGSDTNPGTQSAPIKTITRASAMLGANKRVLFRRGDTFDQTGSLYINYANVVLGAYGSGNKPVWRWTVGQGGYPSMILMHDGTRAAVIEDISFTTVHAPTTGAPRGVHPEGQNITVRRCSFANLADAMTAEGTAWGWLTLGNTAETMGGYFIWGQGADHTHMDNVAAGSYNEHTIRNAGVYRLYIGYNDLTNNIKTTIWCMLGSDAYLAHNTLRNGRAIIGPNFAADSAPSERFPRAVAEGNTILGAQFVLYPGAEHVVLRNNVIDSQGLEAFSIWGWLSGINRAADDIRIYNNTAKNLSNLYGRFMKIGDGATHITAINNLYYAPNLNSNYSGANAYTEDNDLSNNYFNNNLWATPRTGTNVHFFSQTGYSPSQWDALPQVGTERYRLFSTSDLNSSNLPTFAANVGIRVPGVHTDFNGAYRPTGSVITVGAVDLNPQPGGGDPPPPPPPPPPPSNAIVFNMQDGANWTTANSALIDGAWERGVPAGDGNRGDPNSDYDGSGSCWLTGNRAGNSDVDGGPTTLTSPAINASTGNVNTVVSYAAWFTNANASDSDRLRVEISSDNGQTWRFVHSIGVTNGWQVFAFRASDFANLTTQMKVRFIASDNPNNSVTEAGIDDLRMCFSGCATINVTHAAGDVNNDGIVNTDDLMALLAAWGSCTCPADLDHNGSVNTDDLTLLLGQWD